MKAIRGDFLKLNGFDLDGVDYAQGRRYRSDVNSAPLHS